MIFIKINTVVICYVIYSVNSFLQLSKQDSLDRLYYEVSKH